MDWAEQNITQLAMIRWKTTTIFYLEYRWAQSFFRTWEPCFCNSIRMAWWRLFYSIPLSLEHHLGEGEEDMGRGSEALQDILQWLGLPWMLKQKIFWLKWGLRKPKQWACGSGCDWKWFWVNGEPLVSLVSLPSCPAQCYRCGASNTKTNVQENSDWLTFRTIHCNR